MPNIPNTTSPDLTLVSVGNGTNASRWTNATSGGSGITQLTGDVTAGPGSGSVAATVAKINGTALGTLTGATNGYVLTWNSSSSTWVAAAGGNTLGGYAVNVTGLSTSGQMLFWTNLGGTGQWVTTYVPTGTGSMLFWNGLGWESTSTTGIATGNVLVWNNSTSKWVPGAAPLTGDVTGTTSSNQVISLAGGQTLALTGGNFPVSGSIMQYVTSGSTPAWTTGAAPTQNGQILQWNGFAWAQSDTPAPSNGQTLVWNSSIAPTGKWTPGSITLAGDVTGSTASNSIAKLQGNTLSVPGTIPAGSILAYSGVTNAWVGQAVGASVGQVPTWNGSAWAATTPSSGGTTNQAWAVTNKGPGASVTTTPSTPTGWTIGTSVVSGFSTYLITVTGTIRTTTATTVSVGLLINSGGVGTDAGVTVSANASGIATTVVCTNVVTSFGSGSSLTVSGTVYTSAGTGTFYNGNIAVIGIS